MSRPRRCTEMGSVIAALPAGIPTRRRIRSAHTTFIYDGGTHSMKLDRTLQREILVALETAYPEEMSTTDWHRLVRKYGDKKFRANCLYLNAHGLLNWNNSPGGISVYITHLGLDFLADDGGLSAILGVVTVKIHDDSLKTLIESKILQSDLPQPDKQRYLHALRSLPSETAQHLVLKLVDLGLANAPAALGVIGTALGLEAGG